MNLLQSITLLSGLSSPPNPSCVLWHKWDREQYICVCACVFVCSVFDREAVEKLSRGKCYSMTNGVHNVSFKSQLSFRCFFSWCYTCNHVPPAFGTQKDCNRKTVILHKSLFQLHILHPHTYIQCMHTLIFHIREVYRRVDHFTQSVILWLAAHADSALASFWIYINKMQWNERG